MIYRCTNRGLNRIQNKRSRGKEQVTQTDDRILHAPPNTTSWRRIERPLESVVGLAEMLRDRSRDVSATARNEMIDQLAMHARAMEIALDNLIVASQLRNGEIELSTDPIDLRELVETVAQEWTLDRGAHITVTGAVDAICDREWSAFALRNIFEEAYARGGRTLNIRISEAYTKALVAIDDDGEELPDRDIQALAEPHNRGQATDWDGVVLGHGAAIARGLAKAMGGDVRYYRTGALNTCEMTFRKQSTTTANRRGQLPNFTLDPVETRPTREDIAGLLEAESISMVYQPVVDIRTSGAKSSTVVGYESLARFPYASPPEWFKLAGSSGVGLDLELLAIRAGIEGFTSRDPAPFLALNLSNLTLLSPQLGSTIKGIDPGRVVLELSDSARIRSYEVTRRAIDALRERGVRLAVDDVGAGEIDMWHILRLDPEILKLDRHLVADQENVRRNNALIRGITTMASDLGIMVVAEAIETEGERQRLLDLGVEFGQGYLFGKPEPLQWKTRVLSDPESD